ncbi:cuticular protein analogous to peritrophins 1-J isoform X2 [Tribolium castaneum]|uniref:Cuticular protein analogous to peritrophins 1-J n=2 Tax=Tribolium castaneum TaxID=7070 RepID=D1MAI3_TRICA|nr:cuticular protein analogous to peritrophins 1-J precursor [Tribolium castaneum]XP_008198732.1 PREDICTED: cuticular protein analogous to peritrophins 1-J isoform X2 [Tribolium castaneum]ACY95474.1 cuticular protein analogous to peritrophins 1-J [Tribolium castaneum]EEZ97295.1 hypothetical protein TcasGA2_TC011101 [Tribolium castaneum]|eukprot:NP_001161901.1 cuticular protein analogous to peritrophins 1-J precursor [Tribolium castaneum]
MARYHLLKLGLAILVYFTRSMGCLETEERKFNEEDLVFYQGVTGKPGVDFPVLSHIPRTTFNCRNVDSGYYADLETDCQVFHICEEGKKISFLCPNGTIFQQSELICEWWFKVNCTDSPNFYEESAEQLREDNARRKASRRVLQNHGAVMRTEEHSSVSASQNGRKFNVGTTFQETNDLARAPSSDFVRDQKKKGRKPVQFQTQSIEERKSFDDQKVVPSKNHRANERINQNGAVPQHQEVRNNSARSYNQFGTTRQEVVPNNQRNGGRKVVQGSQDQNQKFETNAKGFGTSVVPNRQEKEQHSNPNFQQYSNFHNQNSGFGTTSDFKKMVPSQFNTQQSQQERKNIKTFGTKEVVSNQFNNGQSAQNTFSNSTNREEEINPFFNNGFQDSNTNSAESTDKKSNVSNFSQSFSHRNFNVDEKRTTFSSSTTTTPRSTTKVPPTSSNLQNHNQDYHQIKNLNIEGKGGTIKQTSTVPLTRNDLVNRRLEPNDSDESQITQETSSFYKNSFNRIDQTIKTTSNPHPNHRSTYSEIKEPKFHSTKAYTSLSSVTPQYLTTQPINNGRPFVGSQVGTTLRGFGTKPPTTTPVVPTEIFNVGRTDKSLKPIALSTLSTFTPLPPLDLTVPSQGSFNTGTPSPKTESSTRVIDHATVYGKFVKSGATTPTTGRTKILLSKSVFGTTPKTSAEILSTSDSYNRGNSQVRFFGKVQTTTKIPGVQIISKSDGTTTKPAEILSTSNSYNRGNSQVQFFGKVQTTANLNSISTTQKPFSSSTPTVLPLSFGTTSSTIGTTVKPTVPGFFVTKNVIPKSEIARPRPFQLPPEPDFGQPIFGTTQNLVTTLKPTYPTYKISSASPFSGPSTPEPTLPTPFATTQVLPSTFETVDSMITALAEMANSNNYTENPRPGLVIPPSAGPQTLHTLAQYFANALDGIATEKEDEEDGDEENLTKVELEKKKLTELLTQMTMNRYNELFPEDESTTTVVPNDLEGQHSKSPATPAPKVRQLAKVFTQALSSYLDDPATFKKVLEEVRPTEPPALDETTDLPDDELLNFSDADTKSSYSPFFPPKLPAVRPTWGYLIAYNTTPHNLDVKNSIGGTEENLQGADSQSFVSQFNKLQNQKESTTRSSVLLPEDHWTTSPDATKLWKTAFSFDPASINHNFGTTEPTIGTTTEEVVPAREVRYELHALPKLDLNSTQVHGILIDFMNTTKQDEDNRLQRILRKLNTTEDEFLAKMKEIEANPLTRRLILLLISECGNSTQAVPLHTLLIQNSTEVLQTSSSTHGFKNIDPSLDNDSQDARALQLLNSLYTIASRFGK